MPMTPAIENELERIAVGLRGSIPPDRQTQLYAAQQALSWALEPDGFRRPYDTIMDIQEDLEGCSAPSHLPLS